MTGCSAAGEGLGSGAELFLTTQRLLGRSNETRCTATISAPHRQSWRAGRAAPNAHCGRMSRKRDDWG
jgi:hypothetical protein